MNPRCNSLAFCGGVATAVSSDCFTRLAEVFLDELRYVFRKELSRVFSRFRKIADHGKLFPGTAMIGGGLGSQELSISKL